MKKTMKIKLTYGFVLLIVGLTFYSCKTNNSVTDAREYSTLEQIVESRKWAAEFNWAIPLRGNQINLIGNDNFIRFSNDSVKLFLPYFGVRQMAGGYDPVAGFEYNGLAKEFEINKNKSDNSIEVYFETDQRTEELYYRLTLYAGGNARLRVSSNQRENISYTGNYWQQK